MLCAILVTPIEREGQRVRIATTGGHSLAGEAVLNGAARTDAQGWRAVSAAGAVQLRQVTGITGTPAATTGVRISRTDGTQSPARALMSLRSPGSYFQVGRTYRMQVWVRDLLGSGKPMGILLANEAVTHRPTQVSQYSGFDDNAWHLLTRTFVSTAPGQPDTLFQLVLPEAGRFDVEVTAASVQEVVAPAPDRLVGSAPHVLNFAGPAGTAPSPSVWNHEVGGRWGEGAEVQTYTNSTRNAQLDGGGNLRIIARRESTVGVDGVRREFTSARLTTQGKFVVPPGSYVESAITAPTGAGVWPAFWTLGANLPEVGWPASGELDVLEVLGANGSVALAAAHMAKHSDPRVDMEYGWDDPGGSLDLGHPLDTRAHLYGVYFDGHTVRFYVDRKERMTLWADDALASGRSWPFDKPQFLLLNIAIAGDTDTSRTTFPRVMTVGPISVWNGGVPF